MERNEHLERDEETSSPLFWIHHILARSIQAEELRALSMKAYDKHGNPTVTCRAMQTGSAALEYMADDHWLSFRRERVS